MDSAVSLPAQADPTLITDIRDDLKQECEKFGPTKKFMIFDVSLASMKLEREVC